MKPIYTFLFFLISCSSGFSQYYFNKAARFNNNGYYSSTDESFYDFPGPITIEAWIYMDSVDVDMAICGKNFSTGYAFTLRQNGAGAILRFNVAGAFVNGTAEIPTNTWTHVAVTYDGVNTVQFFINGTSDPVSFGTITGAMPNNSDEFRIGADHFGGVPDFFMWGAIDELRIWDAVLPQAQIEDQMHIPIGIDFGSGPLYTGAEESFRMNVAAPADTMRSETYAYHQMAPHNITLWDFSDKVSSYIDYNSHLIFDGQGIFRIDWNNIPVDMNVGKSLTAEIWVRMDTTTAAPGAFMNIFNQSGGTNEYPFGLYANSTNGTVFFDINGGLSLSVNGGNIRDNQWHHLAGTFDHTTGNMVLYIDGETTDSANFTATIDTTDQSTYSWYLGSIGASSFTVNRLVGSVDEARIWKNTVRTKAEIKKYMYMGMDASITDPDIANLVVFGLDGITRESNVDINQQLPVYYGNFLGAASAGFFCSKNNNNAVPTSPLIRLDASNYPDEFIISRKGAKIPDLGIVSDTIAISGLQTGNPLLLEVLVLANHTYIGDVSMYLYSPDGDSIALINADGSGCNLNDVMTIFTAAADSTIDQECGAITTLVPFSPSIQPEVSLDSLMQGDPNGNWILKIGDNFGGLDGYFHAWGLRLIGNNVGVEPVAKNTLHTYNFPNPFSQVTTIYFELPYAQDVNLTVYDQSGRVVLQRMIGQAVNGANYYQLDIGSLASGIYHYELRAGDHRAMNKMVVSK